MWSSHWNPLGVVGRGVARNGWVQGRGSEQAHRSALTLPATKTTANLICPSNLPLFFSSNGTVRSVSTESRHAQVGLLCLGPGKSLPLFCPPTLSGTGEAANICRAFAVQWSQLFAAIREVNHNTCYGVETRRGHVDMARVGLGLGCCILFIMHQRGKVSLW